jgi:subtilase family serine protease
METAISMASGLQSVVIFNSPNVTDSGLDDILSAIVNYPASNNLHQVSISWGEAFGTGSPADEALLKELAAEGVSVFVASGDYLSHSPSITYPSDSPNVTSVGGTILTTPATSEPSMFYFNPSDVVNWVSETVWDNYGNSIGSVDGVSSTYSIPNWQVSLTEVNANMSTTKRNIPDVAIVAQDVAVTFDTTSSGSYYLADAWGTSAAAPLWAAFTALVNQQAAQAGKQPVGFLNPALYDIGKSSIYTQDFHDITTGNNTHFPAVRSNPAIKPSVVCSFASIADSSFKARMALLVSGPMDASFICGNFFFKLKINMRAI